MALDIVHGAGLGERGEPLALAYCCKPLRVSDRSHTCKGTQNNFGAPGIVEGAAWHSPRMHMGPQVWTHLATYEELFRDLPAFQSSAEPQFLI